MLLREWAPLKYPQGQLFENVRLGPTQAKLVGVEVSPGFARALMVELWYADGLIVLPDQVLVVEAKVKATPGAVGQVKFYIRQLMRMPEMNDLLRLPLIPVVLFAEDDDEVTKFCRQEGVRVELYTPAWIVDYLNQVQFRNRITPPPQPPPASG